MRLLLDTHVLVWATSDPDRLSARARAMLESVTNELYFSVVSIWEATIRHARGKSDFTLHPRTLLDSLRQRDLGEIGVTSDHGLAVAHLPPIHRDPFDRILIAQAQVEGLTLLTADKTIARYPGPILKV